MVTGQISTVVFGSLQTRENLTSRLAAKAAQENSRLSSLVCSPDLCVFIFQDIRAAVPQHRVPELEWLQENHRPVSITRFPVEQKLLVLAFIFFGADV